MFDVIDIVISGVCATAIGIFNYSSIKRDLNRKISDQTKRQMRRQQKLAERELWEHAAYSSAFGIAMFVFLVFNAATNLSYLPFWPRFLGAMVCFVVVLFILRLAVHTLYRYYRNSWAKKHD
ncbi:MAG: hypothetical protein AB8B79_23530 [Granulosicoccus sp.]